MPGEVRHSLGGAELTLSPSPSAASKEQGLRHTAASAAARPQLHHCMHLRARARLRAHKHTICMHRWMCAWKGPQRVPRVGQLKRAHGFFFSALRNSLTERLFHRQGQTSRRISGVKEKMQMHERASVSACVCARRRPIMTCKLKFAVSSEAAHTHAAIVMTNETSALAPSLSRTPVRAVPILLRL